MANCESQDLREDQESEIAYLRRMNKALRTANGVLRRTHVKQGEHMDDIFLALCDADKEAEIVMGELWGSGEFDCGPRDYNFVAERCLEAVREYNERREHPSPTSRCIP